MLYRSYQIKITIGLRPGFYSNNQSIRRRRARDSRPWVNRQVIPTVSVWAVEDVQSARLSVTEHDPDSEFRPAQRLRRPATRARSFTIRSTSVRPGWATPGMHLVLLAIKLQRLEPRWLEIAFYLDQKETADHRPRDRILAQPPRRRSDSAGLNTSFALPDETRMWRL
jgi:hypothetical protein